MRHAALIAFLVMTVSTAACKQHAGPAGSHEPSTPAGTAATQSATTAPSAAPGAIGVTECDEFLRKWESCLATKVPEEAREQVKVALDATRDSWKRAAATPSGTSGLAEACKSASELAEMQVAAYGCTW